MFYFAQSARNKANMGAMHTVNSEQALQKLEKISKSTFSRPLLLCFNDSTETFVNNAVGPVKHIEYDLKQYTHHFSKVLDMQISKFLKPCDILYYEIIKAGAHQRAFVIEFPVQKLYEFGGVMELF